MEYTPIGRFRKFIRRVSDLSKAFGDELQKRGFKTGGTVGQVPRKINSTDWNWVWSNLGWSDITGKPSSFPPSAHTHSISQVTGLQTALGDHTSAINLRALITDTTLVVPTYADNAAALLGGLAVNQVYKTVTGELRIVV